MKKIIVIIFMLIFSNIFAQVNDEYINAKLLKGTYKRIVVQNNRSFESSGEFLVVNGYGICWIAKNPKNSITIMGEKNVTQMLPDGTKKVVADSSNVMFSKIANIIKSIFIYDKKTINESFNKEIVSSNNIILIPKNKELKNIIEKIEVGFSSLEYVEKIKIYSSNNTTTEYIMKIVSKSDVLTSEETKYFE